MEVEVRGATEADVTEVAAIYEHEVRHGHHTALAVVALPNEASETLHRACGFERLGVMREVGHKFDRWIDVSWWQKPLGAA